MCFQRFDRLENMLDRRGDNYQIAAFEPLRDVRREAVYCPACFGYLQSRPVAADAVNVDVREALLEGQAQGTSNQADPQDRNSLERAFFSHNANQILLQK